MIHISKKYHAAVGLSKLIYVQHTDKVTICSLRHYFATSRDSLLTVRQNACCRSETPVCLLRKLLYKDFFASELNVKPIIEKVTLLQQRSQLSRLLYEYIWRFLAQNGS